MTYIPVPDKTVEIVLKAILKSNKNDQLSIYSISSFIQLLKSFIVDRLNKKKQQSSGIKSFSIDNDKNYKRRNSFSGNLSGINKLNSR